MLSGYIMEQYRNKRQGMIKGYQILLYAGIVLLILFALARAIVNRHFKLKMQQQEEEEETTH